MSIELRGHHLLCLLGFRGMGYSEGFARNMRRVYETLRREPETLVEIVAGADEICRAFPCDQPNHCGDAGVTVRDDTVLRHLQLATGDRLPWRQIQERIANQVRPAHLLERVLPIPGSLASEEKPAIRAASPLKSLLPGDTR